MQITPPPRPARPDNLHPHHRIADRFRPIPESPDLSNLHSAINTLPRLPDRK
jgi:hypothetical protein